MTNATLPTWTLLSRLKNVLGLNPPLGSGAGISFGRLFLLTFQLSLLVLVLHTFHVEEEFGLTRLTPLLLVGFVVNALLPLRFRLPFFVALSFGGILAVLGLKQGLGLVGLGLGLLALCHLPVHFWLRVALLCIVGLVLALIRGGAIQTGWAFLPTLVIPVLGAMFMFRLAIYLHDMRHEQKPATIWERLSYFFMLPNVCFLLFPVVDYQTFRRTYYASDALNTYQVGLLWMTRGVIHLLLYRLIYQFFLPAPSDVVGLLSLVQIILTTYLLYLRISGLFHLIVGMMCLFGFALPETHHLYYLASSFNDFWRRINIYWKDFMMKLFYYPSFMRLRKLGMRSALVLSTAVVFIGTWALHGYQWFWLQGTFPITAPDILFWGLLGVFVAVNSLHEAARPPRRRLSKAPWSFRQAVLLSVKTLGMFLFIATLWFLWSSPSIGDWWAAMRQAADADPVDVLLLSAALIAVVCIGVVAQYLSQRGWSLLPDFRKLEFRSATGMTVTTLLVLLLIGQPLVSATLGSSISSSIAAIKSSRLNEHDVAQAERGYYEGLLAAGNFASARKLSQAKVPADWVPIMRSDIARPTHDLLDYDLKPSNKGEFLRATVVTNSGGMRDQEYNLAKPPGTIRIALLGSSYEMGSGVENNESFEALLEERLNREKADVSSPDVEILNFAVNGYGIVQNAHLMSEKVWRFDPDIVFLMGHSAERRRLGDHLRRLVKRETHIPYPALNSILVETGVSSTMVDSEIDRRLQSVLDEVIAWGYHHISEECIARGIRPVWVFVPRTDEIDEVNDEVFVQRLRESAVASNYTTLSLEGAFEGRPQADLMVAPWDGHPGVVGHRLLAEKLYNEIIAHRHLLEIQ